MRASVAVAGSVSMAVVGVFAVSQASQSAAPTVQNSSNASQSAAQTANQVFGGLFTGLSPALVWMGVGALVLISLGLLAATASGGGR